MHGLDIQYGRLSGDLVAGGRGRGVGWKLCQSNHSGCHVSGC